MLFETNMAAQQTSDTTAALDDLFHVLLCVIQVVQQKVMHCG
jgi:hypothetical protein